MPESAPQSPPQSYASYSDPVRQIFQGRFPRVTSIYRSHVIRFPRVRRFSHFSQILTTPDRTSEGSASSSGDGIEASGSGLVLNGGTVSGNGGIGVRLLGNASAGFGAFGGPTITGNGGVGVHLEDGAFAGFLSANITGNLSGLDIDCEPKFPITRFVDRTGGVTNCVEPAAPAQRESMK